MNAVDPVPPTVPTPVTAGAAPWWTSAQFKGLLATFVVALLGIAAHWVPKLAAISYTQVFGWIGDVTEVLVAGGALWALVQRKRSVLQPLTLTQSAAEHHPATIAVVETQALMSQAGIPTAVTLQAQLTKASNGNGQPSTPQQPPTTT